MPRPFENPQDATMRPIFKQFPSLTSHLSTDGFARLPTAVELHSFNGKQIWVKRDDLTHSLYGGNKVRKLEFILPEAQRLGATKVLTFGATGTHHGLATAVFCKQLGLECEVLLFDQPVTALVKENIQLLASQDAVLTHCGSLANTLRRFYMHPGRLRKSNYFLFAGGSNVFGVLAFINAALELAAQVAAGDCEEPEVIYSAASSNATLAGLTLGMAISGLNTKVIGVRVAPDKVGPFDSCTPAAVSKLMQQTVKWLQQHGADWDWTIPEPQIDNNWYGDGYGHETEPAVEAASIFKTTTGIELDPTYTAKCFAAVLASQHQGSAFYWHTLNSHPLDKLLASPVPALPKSLQVVMEEDHPSLFDLSATAK
jgi:1-aminocyclopropane-1-carboxylate deaminase/D-cysteine desulfhydrase-like pyridoxal-dependent ACC family enzyme